VQGGQCTVEGVNEGVVAVPVFLIERRFAEDLEASAEVNDRINRINEEEGVRWLYSFLSADKRKTYCLYEAPLADAIRRAASRAGLPADAVLELAGRVLPDGSFAELAVG
jgi:exoribonuclease II